MNPTHHHTSSLSHSARHLPSTSPPATLHMDPNSNYLTVPYRSECQNSRIIIQTPLQRRVSEGRVVFRAKTHGRPRRVQAAPPPPPSQTTQQHEQQEYLALFIDPMMGTPLPIYVGEDVENREHLVHLITVSVSLHAWRSQVAPCRFHHGIWYKSRFRWLVQSILILSY